MSHEKEKRVGPIKGVIYGKPYTEVTPVGSPSEYPKSFPPNPKPQILLREIKDLTCALDQNHSQKDLPWSPHKVNIHTLFKTLVTFTDDHTETIYQEYFPTTQINHCIEEIISTSKLKGTPLQLPEQLKIALKYANGQLLPASILAHSASRVIGRNRDQRVDTAFKFDANIMQQWSASIARFDDARQFDPPGDTYHFWATFSMGLALKSLGAHDQPASLAYRILFYYGADLLDFSRKFIAKNPLQYKHKEVDRLGLRIGWILGSVQSDTHT